MIIASNFKTNHTRRSTRDFVEEIDSKSFNSEIRIYPPATALDRFEIFTNLKVGAQNFYPVQNGSFTGEIGYEQLEEFGIDSVLVGHSERRHVLKESDSLIVEKFDFAKEKGLEILYCIGEPKEVREEGFEAVMSYLWEQFEGIDIDYERLVVAYEPVWAIGTGLSATTKDIKETLKALKTKIKAPILYGGSVKVENIKEILEIDECEGVLVGTASWKVENFSKMIEIADNIRK